LEPARMCLEKKGKSKKHHKKKKKTKRGGKGGRVDLNPVQLPAETSFPKEHRRRNKKKRDLFPNPQLGGGKNGKGKPPA